MKLLLRLLLATLFVLTFKISLFACEWDTDCDIGSRCLKQGFNFYGYCAGGMNNGNSYDRHPAYNPLDYGQTEGKSCMSTVECEFGEQCMRDVYGGNGVCR